MFRQKELIVVDIADLKVTNRRDVELVTYALGSCIGVAIFDPVAGVGGMLHFMLPESSMDEAKAKNAPLMFADTAVPRLFRATYDLGAIKSRLRVKIAGGSNILDNNDVFSIGKRNYLSLRKIFWKNNVMVDAEDVGGSHSRTMRLDMATGDVTIHTSGCQDTKL